MTSRRWALLTAVACGCGAGSTPAEPPPTPLVEPGPVVAVAPASDLCAEVTCTAWRRCELGACVLPPGRCEHYTDCAADEFCDGSHICAGPTVPGADFWADSGGDRVVFGYRGTIQPYDDLETGQVILGIADFDARVGGTREHLDDSAYVGRLSTGGMDVLALGASRILSEEGANYRYAYVTLGLPVSGLKALAGKGPGALGRPVEGTWLGVREVDVRVRSFDGAVFKRYCPRADYDRSDGGSLFLNAFANTSFAVGEDLQVWGNLPVRASPPITAENEASLCTFYKDDGRISAETWHQGVAATRLELSCGVPESLSPDPGTPAFSFRFVGPINDTAIPFGLWAYGVGELGLPSLAEPIVADDSYELVYRYQSPRADRITFQTVGGLVERAPGRYSYNRFYVSFSTSALRAIQQSGGTVALDPATTTALLESTEIRPWGGREYVKSCPRAVLSDAAGPLLAACTQQGQSFAPGEILEIAGLLPATTDPARLRAVYGADCGCFSGDKPIDCASFDALGSGGAP